MEMLNSIFEIKAGLGWAGLGWAGWAGLGWAGWAGQTARCVQVSISRTGTWGRRLFSLTPGQGRRHTAAAEDEDAVMMMVTRHLHHHLQFLCHSNTPLTVY